MSKVLITRSKLDDLATTIAAKSGATLPLTIAQMDAAVEGIETGGNVFVVTLYYNDQTEMWEPDCTYAEVQAAYSAGKAATVQTDGQSDTASADGEIRNEDGVYSLTYWTRQFDDSDGTDRIIEHSYMLDSDGLRQTGEYTYSRGSVVTVLPISVTANGTYTASEGEAYSPVTVNVPTPVTMNVQTYQDYDYVSSTSYIATDVTLTVEVSGTYDVSWMGWRNTTSGTSGSQIYVNGSSRGSAHTTFVGSYGQFNTETGVSLNAGDVVVIRARSRSTSYRMYVGGLILQQTA